MFEHFRIPSLSAGDLTERRNLRLIYSSIIINQRDLANNSTVRKLNLSESDLLFKKGERYLHLMKNNSPFLIICL